MADLILFEKVGHVGVFTLNRPKQHNAVSRAVSERMESLLDAFEADDSLWIGIIRSSHPKTFCAGADLKAVSEGNGDIGTEKGGFCGLVKYPKSKPLIAAVDGKALAGGCEIVLTCDMVVASTASSFGVPEVKRSLVPGAGGMFRLPRKIPRHVAMEMVLTGDPITAERAYQLGFVNRLVDPGKAFNEAMKLAEQINVNAPIAVREAMHVVNNAHFVEDEEAWKQTNDAFRVVVKSEDFMEGPRAFVEKRAPQWTGKMTTKSNL